MSPSCFRLRFFRLSGRTSPDHGLALGEASRANYYCDWFLANWTPVVGKPRRRRIATDSGHDGNSGRAQKQPTRRPRGTAAKKRRKWRTQNLRAKKATPETKMRVAPSFLPFALPPPADAFYAAIRLKYKHTRIVSSIAKNVLWRQCPSWPTRVTWFTSARPPFHPSIHPSIHP